MPSLNKCHFMGHLGKDPEIRATSGGKQSATFSIACTEKWRDKSGTKQEKTEWVNVVAWGALAEICAKYLKKGSPVYIEGRMQTRKWQDKEGRDRYSTEIVANELQMLGGKPEAATSYEPPARPQSEVVQQDFDDKIPF